MTKKELKKKVEELEREALDRDFDKRRLEGQLKEAMDALSYIACISYKFKDDPDFGLDTVRMFADNAWIVLHEGY